jgi:hypothetical protein
VLRDRRTGSPAKPLRGRFLVAFMQRDLGGLDGDASPDRSCSDTSENDNSRT